MNHISFITGMGNSKLQNENSYLNQYSFSEDQEKISALLYKIEDRFLCKSRYISLSSGKALLKC